MDHALEPLKDALKIICSQRPNWPVLVVQTNLHEGYLEPKAEHIIPYPYENQEASGSVPQNLMRSLKFQQQELSEWTREFVAVDLTQPNDGYLDSDYGLDELWKKIEMEYTRGDGFLDKLCMELVGMPSSRCRPPTRDIRERYRQEAKQMLIESRTPRVQV